MEKKFVSIWFPWLVTDWICVKNPALKNSPLVVCAASHGRVIIHHLNSIAAKEGIYKGMTLADARVILPGLEPMNERPGLVEKLLKKIAEWCIRFTPVASPDPPNGILLDASGCSHLWKGDEQYIHHIRKRLLEKGYSVRISMAPTPGAAWALSRFEKDLSVIKNNQLTETIIKLPPESLRIPEETSQLLHRLGLKKLDAFIHFPKTVLRNRFGNIINERIEQMLGSKTEILQPVHLPAEYTERLTSLEPILNRKGIEWALEQTLKGLITQLMKAGLGIRKCRFRIYTFEGNEQEISIHTSRPSCNQKHLYRLFEENIDQLNPGAGIELFLLEATVVEKNNAAQISAWNHQQSSEIEIAEWMDRIHLRLGNDRVFRFLPAEHHWPERSYCTAKDPAQIKLPQWSAHNRPVELLANPERIEVTAPVPDYPPMLFIYKGKLHRIKRAEGPERIEREWWLDEGTHRDYYYLEDEEGQRYWVFRADHYSGQGDNQWFLCGFFP